MRVFPSMLVNIPQSPIEGTCEQDNLGNIYISGGHFFSQPLIGIW